MCTLIHRPPGVPTSHRPRPLAIQTSKSQVRMRRSGGGMRP
jgi:hypothetical protein